MQETGRYLAQMQKRAPDKVRRRAVQNRTLVTRARIANGAIEVLASVGVQGLTHRAVARAAGVNLAATTYHFETKADIVEEASRTLLESYLAAFRRMADRIGAGEETRFASLNDLVERVVLNAIGRDRTRSLAWSELILHGGRSPSGRKLAQTWYEQLDGIWHRIARLIAPGASQNEARAAIDLTVGLTFFLHPLAPRQKQAGDLLSGRVDPDPLLSRIARVRARRSEGESEAPSRRFVETRQKIVEVAIDIIVREGAAGISHRRVAEVAGMVRSGPSYYFPAIDELIETAQTALFERAKSRYRAGIGSHGSADMDVDRLLDLTTAIFFREALEFGSESIGHYSVWISSAQNPSLRPAVAASLLDGHRAWMRRIASVTGAAADPRVAMRMQSLFIGKLIRATAAAVPVADLSTARADFAAVLNAGR
jgi:DNA-binding transcriptional regulator YbjK